MRERSPDPPSVPSSKVVETLGPTGLACFDVGVLVVAHPRLGGGARCDDIGGGSRQS
jgi:hypothetical protein